MDASEWCDYRSEIEKRHLLIKWRDRPESTATKKPDLRSSFQNADEIFRFVKSFPKPRKSENRFTQKTGRTDLCPIAQ